MSFVYHYHATKQLSSGNVVNIDGLMLVNDPIVDMERYREVRGLIVKDQGLGYGEGLVINSLSMLHGLAERPAAWGEEVAK